MIQLQELTPLDTLLSRLPSAPSPDALVATLAPFYADLDAPALRRMAEFWGRVWGMWWGTGTTEEGRR